MIDVCNVQWMEKINALIINEFGLDIDDLPDYDYTEDYMDGLTPEQCLMNYKDKHFPGY